MRDRNIHSEILIAFEILAHHLGEMMGVNDYVSYSKVAQASQRDLEQRAASDFYQRLRPVLREWAQARS